MNREDRKLLSEILFGDGEERSNDDLMTAICSLNDLCKERGLQIDAMESATNRHKIEIDRLELQASAAKATAASQHEEVLSQLRNYYGEDLSWDNLVERAGGAVSRLQSQAVLMQAAETEMRRMRGRLDALEKDGECDETGVAEKSCSCMSGNAVFEHRITRLEEDLAVFSRIGRLISRVIDLDKFRIIK